MKTKALEQIVSPPPSHMVGDGFKVHNFFPQALNSQTRMSPFFLLDYGAETNFPPTDKPRGVGVHPHRGFETVTIAYKGSVAHHDSSGNSGVIGEGEVQWMTAASGILHKEYHEKEYSKKGGPFQMVQLWVNLPAKDKMSKPKYQAISRADIGIYTLPNNDGKVEVIAGEFHHVKGPAYTFTPIHMYNIHLKKGTQLSFDLPEHFNTAIVMIEGSTKINNNDIAKVNSLSLFKNEGETIALQAEEDSILLVLSGEPIHEPIAAYGPFLMNTKQEIMQAFDDYNLGKFGYLEG